MRIISVIALAFLSACASSSGSLESIREVELLRFSENTAGPITGAEKLGKAQLSELFPNSTVDSILTAQEQKTIWALAVFQEGVQIIQVIRNGSTVSEVHGVGSSVTGPGQKRVGTFFRQSGFTKSDCRVGKSLWIGAAICRDPDTPNIDYVYSISEYSGPFDILPNDDILATAVLQRIVWRPQ